MCKRIRKVALALAFLFTTSFCVTACGGGSDSVEESASTATVESAEEISSEEISSDESFSQESSEAEHEHTYSEDWSYEATGHWHANTCGCDDYITADWEQHEMEEVVTKEATETEAGSATITCKICGYSYESEIPALGHTHTFSDEYAYDSTYHWYPATCGHADKKDLAEHSFGNWTVVTSASCETDGEETRSCVCGYVETKTISATGHSYADDWSKDDTHHWYAATCDHDVKDGYAEHDYAEEITTQADCKNEGVKTFTCVCGDSYTESIPTVAHNYVDGSCSKCGEAQPAYKRVDADGNEDPNGTHILFGSYPQSKVTDTDLVTTLNEKAGTAPNGWINYGYYYGELDESGYNIYNKNAVAYMWYIDITVNDAEYRGVYFTHYRTGELNIELEQRLDESSITLQADNGYYINTVYWFKYEPIQWTILTDNYNETGGALLICDMVIDYQPFKANIEGATGYLNNYEESAIRQWLNNTFYTTAFVALEKELIKTVLVDNSKETTNNGPTACISNNTSDKVFLVSYQEAVT